MCLVTYVRKYHGTTSASLPVHTGEQAPPVPRKRGIPNGPRRLPGGGGQADGPSDGPPAPSVRRLPGGGLPPRRPGTVPASPGGPVPPPGVAGALRLLRLAEQGPGVAAGDPGLYIPPDEGGVPSEVDQPAAVGAAGEGPLAVAALPVHQDPEGFAHVGPVAPAGDAVLLVQQPVEPDLLLLPGGGVGEPGRRRARPGGVDEGEQGVEADLLQHLEGVLKFLGALAGKAHNDVGGEGDVGDQGLEGPDFFQILLPGVAAVHHPENPVVPRLEGQGVLGKAAAHLPQHAHHALAVRHILLAAVGVHHSQGPAVPGQQGGHAPGIGPLALQLAGGNDDLCSVQGRSPCFLINI